VEQNFENDFSVLYENDSTSNYLVLRTGIDKTIINYQAHMLLNNKLNGLLEFNLNHIGDGVNCFYNVTSKCTLASFMSRKRFSRDEFLITILNIINNIYQLKNYLLYDNNILLDENFIYVEPESIDIYFVYLPFLDCQNDIKAFFIKFIFKLVKFHDEYSDNYIQKILEAIKNDNFNLGNLKSLIENLLGEEIKNQTSKNWRSESSNNTQEKEFGLGGKTIDNGLDMTVNTRLQKNGKYEIEKAKTGDNSEIDKIKTSRFNADKAEIDKVKTRGFKWDKAEKDKDKTVNLIADRTKTGRFNADKTNTDKTMITRGNIRIPNSQNIKSQEQKNLGQKIQGQKIQGQKIQGQTDYEQKNLNLFTKTKAQRAEQQDESDNFNKKVKLLMLTILLLQPFLLITLILTVNSSFVKMSENPMNTVIILILIFLSLDVLAIRIINEKRKKADETSSYKPLQFITDMMKSKKRAEGDDSLHYVYNTQEDQLPVLNESYNGETVIIKKPKPTEKPYLKEKGGEEVVEINKKSVLIGRMESFVDFVINSSAIGKIHAEILQEGEDFYVMDCNSRNGTFLNDNRIIPNTKNKVSNNDLIRFANKEFVFFYSLKPQESII
jgi:hypothetical protein